MVEHHTWTGILLLVAAVAAGIAGLFFTLSQGQVTGFPEHDLDQNEDTRNASRNLLIAYILSYIAAALLLVLAIVYFFQGSLNWSEWPHLIIYLIIFAAIIIAGVFAFIALSDIDSSGVADKKSSVGYLWAGLGLLLASVLVLLVSGAWRVQHVATTKKSKVVARTTHCPDTFTTPGSATSYSVMPGSTTSYSTTYAPQ